MTLPPPITAHQLAHARQLVAARHRKSAQLATLKRRLSDAQHDQTATNKHFTDRLFLFGDANRMSGLAEFCQRQHPVNHRRVIDAYRRLLQQMYDPPVPFKRLDEPAIPKPPPHTVDFAALALPARPYFIGPYLDIHPGDRFAEVDLLRSRPAAGHVVIQQTGGPVNIEHWRERLSALNAWLTGGTAGLAWAITAHAATTVTLTRQLQLPALIPFNRTFLQRGALFVGIDTVQRTPLYIPFSELSAGTYIPGTSGSGKTSALHILLRSLFANLDLFSACWLVDGKDGVAMARYAKLHPKVKVLYDEPDVWRLAADLNELMRARNASQRAHGTDKATRDFVAVVVDELPTFIADPPKAQAKEHAAFINNLQRIAMRGRSAGIRMFFITQTPVKDQIPVTLRANCATTIAFRLPEQTHATSIFGELKTLPDDPRKLPTGQALVLQADTGRITTVQFPFAPLYQPRGRP